MGICYTNLSADETVDSGNAGRMIKMGFQMINTSKIHELITYFAKLVLSTLSLVNRGLLFCGLLSHEKIGENGDFYFAIFLLRRPVIEMIGT